MVVWGIAFFIIPTQFSISQKGKDDTMDTDKPTRNRTGTPSPSILARRGMMAGLILLVAIIAIFAIFLATTPPAASPAAPPAAPSQTPAATVKSASPVVELFVMSFCPFGTQAETAMEPVVNLLGSEAQISVRYIATVQGTTADSVSSLHGPAEAQEDLRQLCINKYYPGQFWPYLTAFIQNCYPKVQNATLLGACQGSTMQALGIDTQKIGTCATGGEGLGLLSADEQASSQYGVQASPTLIINGQPYDGDRTPEAYKEAICSHFETPPAECSVNLSAQAVTSTGGCG